MNSVKELQVYKKRETVCPLSAASVFSILHFICFASSTDNGFVQN